MPAPIPQPGRFIDPLTDFGFKRLFGHEPNKGILINFLNQLFVGRKVIRDLTYSPTERHGDNELSKKVFFDLLCVGDKGEQFIVEMQRAEQGHFKDRAVFYTSRLISEQLRKGKKAWSYGLKEVYLIALLEFAMEGSGEGYLHDYYLMDPQTGKIFYDKIGYKFIELPKFTKVGEQLETDLDRWLFLLKHMSRLDRIPVYMRKGVFQKVFKIAEISMLTKEERMLYDSSLKAKWDYDNSIRFAEMRAAEKAEQVGISKGVDKTLDKTTRNMILEGYADMAISKVLEVTPDYVAAIRREMEKEK